MPCRNRGEAVREPLLYKKLPYDPQKDLKMLAIVTDLPVVMEPFLVAHADNLTRFDMKGFEAVHEARPPGFAITMLAFETDDPRSCGILEFEDAAGPWI
eukprot:gene59465-81395_t